MKSQLIKLGSMNPELRPHIHQILKHARKKVTYDDFVKFMSSKGIRPTSRVTEVHALSHLKGLSYRDLYEVESVIRNCQDFYDPQFKLRKILENGGTVASEEFEITKLMYIWEAATSRALIEAKKTVAKFNDKGTLEKMWGKYGPKPEKLFRYHANGGWRGQAAEIVVSCSENDISKSVSDRVIEVSIQRMLKALPPVLRDTTYTIKYFIDYPPDHVYYIYLKF